MENSCSFFWSNTPLPWMRYLTLATFRKHNPNWKIKLYTANISEHEPWESNHPQDAKYYTNQLDYREKLDKLNIEIIPFDLYPNLASVHMADMCRWYVLANGGIFADMDILFMNSMKLYNFNQDAISHNGKFFRIGLVSGIKDGFFRDILKYAETKIGINNGYQGLGVEILYEFVGKNTRHQDAFRKIQQMAGNDIVLIPMSLVHPLAENEILFNKPPTDIIGLHWYAGYYLHRWHVENLYEDNIITLSPRDELMEACARAFIEVV